MRAWIAFLLAWLCPASSALAENRLALVIGNGDYQHIAALEKAKADAKSYADLLREKGYSVQEGYDLGFIEMVGAVARFAEKIQPGDTVVFVYSGHGWSDGTTNYVVGVDAPASEGQGVLARVSLPIHNGLNGVLDNFTRKGAGLKVAIIDAGHDNPFQPPLGERGYGLERGLRPQSVEGSFVIYSAGEGQSALDRLSDADPDPNSVFTREFLALLRADLPLRDAVKISRAKTYALAAAVDHDQTPAYYDEVPGEACLSRRCKELNVAPASSPPESAFAAMIDAQTSPDTLAGLIASLPEGPLKDRAKQRLAALKKNYAVVPVFYATDRNRISESTPIEVFGVDRAALSFGFCYVSIPRGHVMGELESPSIYRFEFHEDPEEHVVLLQTIATSKDDFFKTLATKIHSSSGGNAFLFIHGFNTSFEDAARRTAQIAFDLNFDGAPVFYSWPSQGALEAYTVDEQNIEWAQADLRNFLDDFFTRSDAQNVYLIAHSMGNRALTRGCIPREGQAKSSNAAEGSNSRGAGHRR
jgi:Alpha/beta hydrolase of unknown function (DUF900)/Caspase domain